MLPRPIYLDHHATTPLAEEVLDSMIPYYREQFGNAGSPHHWYGRQASDAVEHAREQVASLINAESSEILFTSSATEANNLALKGIFLPNESGHLGKLRLMITLKSVHPLRW